MTRIKTIDDRPIDIWIKDEGYYVMVSVARGEVRFVLGFDQAEALAKALLKASNVALQSVDGAIDER